MDKNAIKKYAVWARRELIERVSQRAMIYGITAKDAGDPNAESVNGHLLSQAEKRQRQALMRNIKTKGYEQVMEEVAYTWFNRFAALRFMEVNGYLPSHIRVFTNDAGEFKPQILAEAIHLELDGLDMNKVYELESANKSEELFKYLLIVQCNALNSILPGMFQRIEDYTELLLPDYLLRESSVIEQMVTTIPEEDWTDQVQIIGWLYQYYNTEPKDKVFADLKKNIKISKENIPAATQLFTPDWIVHYMVENSLGRLWLEGHPNDALKSEWKYYLDEAEQEPEVQAQLATIRKEYAVLKPEEIRVIDPCMGSGHILCVLFDVLVRIYEDYGYTAREAAVKIIENNLWGLDIDERAAQLSYFAVMMKARQYDRRFFTRKVQPHVYGISSDSAVTRLSLKSLSSTLSQEETEKAIEQILQLSTELQGIKDFGSIINVTPCDWNLLRSFATERFESTQLHLELFDESNTRKCIHRLVNYGELLSQKYHVVTTNPPYMGSKGMNADLLGYIQSVYPSGKSDIYAAFVLRIFDFLLPNGECGLITPYVWMYLSSFENLRNDILHNSQIQSLIQLEYNAFEAACVPVCIYTLRKTVGDYTGRYIQLSSFKGWENQEPKVLAAIQDYSHDYCFETLQSKFDLITGKPIAYWLKDSIYHVFEEGTTLDKFGMPRQGMATADNGTFMRHWFEVSIDNLDLYCKDAKATLKKWYPHSKGGSLRRWYGNNDFVMNWQNDGSAVRAYPKSVVRNPDYYFKPGITWSDLTISWFSARYVPEGFTFDSAGPTYFVNNPDLLPYLTGYFNSWVFQEFLNISCQGMHYSNGIIAKLPVMFGTKEQHEIITNIVNECIALSKKDWDEIETSWDFKRTPYMIDGETIVEDIVNKRIEEKASEVQLLRSREAMLNELFADIFSMQDVTPSKGICEPTLREITPRSAIIELISYSVGCMFGRYSIDEPGLIYAGGKWEQTKYKTYIPDNDAIIPICDDEYFEDDIVGRFVKFVETVFGSVTLEENLRYIADILGGKGSSREVIRGYFLNDFYADHLKAYQKRPIYWLFDSGKKDGFKCLVYMHRYQPDTIARIRTDYVHEQQSRYRTAIADLEQRISNTTTSERVRLNKRLTTIKAQAEEVRIFEEKVHHFADQMISIDLDNGVKKNYEIFSDLLAKIR